jgi:hypothetical protein
MMVGQKRYRKFSIELSVSPVVANRSAPLRELCHWKIPSTATRPAVQTAIGTRMPELKVKGFHGRGEASLGLGNSRPLMTEDLDDIFRVMLIVDGGAPDGFIADTIRTSCTYATM